ncbi:hypothetical protein Bca4012_082710 [Brassica carinata]|uniref:Uncharacterized protein n=1 Tax=Brassica carinata TaxID=52824 RepID=A0A8X7VBE5_BRACI|nr:hypothetical protein Bca52824_027971 [Brassica carinata]
MQRSQDQRIHLGELKGQIVKKIGVERSKKYFYYLSRFLCQKLTKREFDKSCFRLLGRENLSLHNHLIRSILRNASVSKSPPTVQDLAKPIQSRGDGSLVPNHNNDHVWSNRGLPISPRKVRSGMRDRKMRDTPLGSNGHSSVRIENGFDHQRSGRYGATDRDEDDDGENQVNDVSMSSPLVAPLGIPFCSASVGGGSRRTVPVLSTVMSCYDSGGLVPDTEMLRKRMESIAVAHGLEGVSMECANTLNTMLDVYLKKLIKSCTHLVGPSDRTQDHHHHSVSLLDFRTAMELNPQQLGENWPTLLERISVMSFEEQDLEV